MSVSSITSQHSTIFSLDKILQDIPETAIEELSDIKETYQSYKEELNIELKTTDRVWLEFHAGQCEQYGKAAQSILYRIVKASINCPENNIAAANAITILKVMKVSFSCLDLRGVHVPEADLSSSILDKADLSDANLENANLIYASLNGTNMSKANLKNVKFDLPFNVPNVVIHEHEVLSSVISPDNIYLVSEDTEYIYFWNLISKTCIKKIERPNPSDPQFSKKIFSANGMFLFIYAKDCHIDILSVGDFEHVKKLEIFEGRFFEDRFFEVKLCNEDCSFSSNELYHVVTYRAVRSERGIKRDNLSVSTIYLKLWEIQKANNKLLDFKLKSKISISERKRAISEPVLTPFKSLDNICFSKKFPIFYSLHSNFGEESSGKYLRLWKIKELPEAANMEDSDKKKSFFIDVCVSVKVWGQSSCIVVCNMGNSNEEYLFIACGKSIYSIKILEKNDLTWALESAQVTEVTTDDDIIYAMQIFEKTHELVYVCKNRICLYSIRNKRIIGKFRLLDRELSRSSVSFDEKNIYISYLNKIFVHSVDALKSSKYISYEVENKAACFSPDMRSVISLSASCDMQMYDVETGNLLKIDHLEKLKSQVLNHYHLKYEISFSPNARHILISGRDRSGTRLLHVINTENQEIYWNFSSNSYVFVPPNNFEYFALESTERNLTLDNYLLIYKTTPSLHCIGKIQLKNSISNYKIAMTIDSDNDPKVALFDGSVVVIYSFVFKDATLELKSKNELVVCQVLHMQFIEHKNALVIICTQKIILWDIRNNQHEEYNIQASYADISRDGSLIIYYNFEIDDQNIVTSQLSLWSITQTKTLITQALSLTITKLQISPDNRYIIATTENGGMYVWKIIENTFRLLWRTSHNLQTHGLTLGGNNLEKDVDDLILKMGAIKIDNT